MNESRTISILSYLEEPIQFSGYEDTISSNQWAEDFQHEADLCGWPEHVKLFVARKSIVGLAALWLESEEEKRYRTFQELLADIQSEKFPSDCSDDDDNIQAPSIQANQISGDSSVSMTTMAEANAALEPIRQQSDLDETRVRSEESPSSTPNNDDGTCAEERCTKELCAKDFGAEQDASLCAERCADLCAEQLCAVEEPKYMPKEDQHEDRNYEMTSQKKKDKLTYEVLTDDNNDNKTFQDENGNKEETEYGEEKSLQISMTNVLKNEMTARREVNYEESTKAKKIVEVCGKITKRQDCFAISQVTRATRAKKSIPKQKRNNRFNKNRENDDPFKESVMQSGVKDVFVTSWKEYEQKRMSNMRNLYSPIDKGKFL